MKKRSSSFIVIGLLFVIIGTTMMDDNMYLKYGFLLLGIAFLSSNLFSMFKNR